MTALVKGIVRQRGYNEFVIEACRNSKKRLKIKRALGNCLHRQAG